MTKKLQGQVALVTGGSRGIGAAIAKKLGQDGADVVISYSASADRAEAVSKEVNTMGVRSVALKADQANPVETNQLIESVIKSFGTLNILVVNAGVFVTGNIDDANVDLDALEHQHAVNLTGVAKLVRSAVKHMPNGARIIVIGSIAGSARVPGPGLADYSATKAALTGYVRGWAHDLGAKNITVNLIQPGPIATDMNPEDTDFAQRMVSEIPLGRYGRPEEVAAAVAFIASPEAAFITGASLNINGGFTA